ncbi:ABC transporter ATP-binding protein [Catenulispora yoronensis]|uniref:ABC transporter ATP-binding protein n=1 Tax=Catenulispora yoronensis TaxID=450799 RepID=A0ABP5GE88_9ACTN
MSASGRSAETVRKLLRYTAPERFLLVLTLLLAAAGTALSALGPKLLGKATDLIFAGTLGRNLPPGTDKAATIASLRAAGRGELANLLSSADFAPGAGVDFGQVGDVLATVSVLFLLVFLLGVLQARLTAIAVNRWVHRLRRDVQAKLSRLPLGHLDGRPRGEILSLATNDIDNLGQSLQQTLGQVVLAVLGIIGAGVMMFLTSPTLLLATLLTVPLPLLVAARTGARSKPRFVEQAQAMGRLNAYVEEAYSGHALVRAFGRSEESAAAFQEHNEAFREASFKAQFISGLIQPATTLLGNLTYVLIAVVGGLRVASGAMSLGSVQAFIQYSRQFNQPLTQAAAMANLLQSGLASAERVFDLLEAPELKPDPVPAVEPSRVRGHVEFRDVSFGYSADHPLIEHLSLTIEPGQTVAIVGPTGAGKTTLVNLLMRLYEIDSGQILLDDVDTALMTREGLRSHTGMVLQDAWLFGGTIAENIAYGTVGAGRDQIRRAAVATQVDHFVRTLPDGYDTMVDDEGSNLSAGEKQLITIARAFLAQPAILILDEATSSVDTRTEVLIQRAMNTLREGRTSFIIAHRLSTVRDADLILVMENGRVVEQGTHDALLRNSGAYSRLYKAQFSESLDE